MQRYYRGDNVINLRDLGGYACQGGFTAFGRAARAGVLRAPSGRDLQNLRSLGIRTVIDLRGNEEARDIPSFFENNPDFDYYHISLLETNPAFARNNLPMTDVYKLSLTEYSENFARVLGIIASLDTPFMFHCFCGKDRTGLLAALLLSASGVCKEDIIADYEVSYTYIKPAIEREIRKETGLIWDGAYERFYSHSENMEKILDYISEEFGGTIGYFKKIGLNDAQIEALCDKLI